MTEHVESLAPLVKSVVVPLEPAQAFQLFTARFGSWWPLATHSVGQADAVSVSFPSEVGGSIIETSNDGSTSTWGTVSEWSPPTVVRFSWHAGQSEETAGEVEVRFDSDGGTGTVVILTHSGWERRPDGAAARRGYGTGWDPVLAAVVVLSVDEARALRGSGWDGDLDEMRSGRIAT
jgi:uncharacterized protein YndB with AHSA1/START domain